MNARRCAKKGCPFWVPPRSAAEGRRYCAIHARKIHARKNVGDPFPDGKGYIDETAHKGAKA